MAFLKNCLLITAVAVIWHIALAANPGYYNHDELQRADALHRLGFAGYARSFLHIVPGDSFEVPVRPVSFIVQGLLSFTVYTAPYLTHLGSVLLHSVACCLLWLLLGRMEGTRAAALPAALLFAISPLATFAAGWTAALMDLMYTIFGLLAGYLAVTAERRSTTLSAAAIGLLTALALFSKETAAVMPALAVVLVWHGWTSKAAWFSRSRATAILLAVVVPVAAYIVFRWHAIAASISGAAGAAHYALSAGGAIPRMEIYFAYPFLRSLTDAGGGALMPGAYLAFGVLAHIWVVWAIRHAFGLRAASIYLACYTIPLAMILFITGIGSHYLYASGAALSTALGLLMIHAWGGRKRLMQSLLVLLVLVLASHSMRNQMYIHGIGRCMSRAMTSLESKHIAMGRPSKIRIEADADAPVHILLRFATGRDRVGDSEPVQMEITQDPSRPADSSTVRFSGGCLCY